GAGGDAATFVALASHIIGGGSMPSLWGIIVPLALSTLVCVLLAGRKLSLWRLSASVVASQALFHQLFTVFTPLASAPGPTSAVEKHAHHHARATSSMAGVGIGSGDPTDPAMSSGAHAHGSLPMLLAHLAAAVLTIVLIYWAEALPAKLCEFGRRIIRALLPVFSRPRAVPEGPRPTVIIRLEQPRRPGIVRSPVLRRGPPAHAFCTLTEPAHRHSAPVRVLLTLLHRKRHHDTSHVIPARQLRPPNRTPPTQTRRPMVRPAPAQTPLLCGNPHRTVHPHRRAQRCALRAQPTA